MKVLDGSKVWDLHETHGMVLELSLPLLAERDIVPSWLDLIGAARKSGVNISRFMVRLRNAILDSYPPEFAAEILLRLP